MILKGSQRAGASNLSNHLMNDRDNDHVSLLELRGFISSDLHGALTETYAISRATQCKQFMFSLSLNPPKDHSATEEDFLNAADQAELKLGLQGQPRAIVVHEKEGRRHAHVVWSRIDTDAMKAINLPFFKRKLNDLSRDLYLDHGWQLPEGLQMNGGKSPLNFTLQEWQQAKRQGIDPREIKQVLQDCYHRSDSLKGFQNSLEDRGYFLAKGDRRGFVALDVEGNIYSLSKWSGVKVKDLKAKLGSPEQLQSVTEAQSHIKARLTDQMKDFIKQVKAGHARDFEPLKSELKDMVTDHCKERDQLQTKQDERWQEEVKTRSERLNKGVRGLFDWISGKGKETKVHNEQEAYQCLLRDREQRNDLINAQMKERKSLQHRFDKLRQKQKQDRAELAVFINRHLNISRKKQEFLQHRKDQQEALRHRALTR